jgi:hypothetical protein
MTDDFMTEFAARAAREHAAEVAAGKHDGDCEWRDRHWLCHCAKRRRIAAGFTEPPGPLIYRNPECPRCLNPVSHDGDVFVCDGCRVQWSPTDFDDPGEFTDDYGVLDGHLRIDAREKEKASYGSA